MCLWGLYLLSLTKTGGQLAAQGERERRMACFVVPAGEVIFTPPFLTAMSNAEDTVEMLHEMSTVGVGMAVLVTCVWALGCLAIDHAAGMRKALLGETA